MRLPLAFCVWCLTGALLAGAHLSAAHSADQPLEVAVLLRSLLSSAEEALRLEAKHGEAKDRSAPSICNGDEQHKVKALTFRLGGTEASPSPFLSKKVVDAAGLSAWGGGSVPGNRPDLWALGLAEAKLDWLCKLDWRSRAQQERRQALDEHREGLEEVLNLYADEVPEADMQAVKESDVAKEEVVVERMPQHVSMSAAQFKPKSHAAVLLPVPPALSSGDASSQLMIPAGFNANSAVQDLASKVQAMAHTPSLEQRAQLPKLTDGLLSATLKPASAQLASSSRVDPQVIAHDGSADLIEEKAEGVENASRNHVSDTMPLPLPPRLVAPPVPAVAMPVPAHESLAQTPDSGSITAPDLRRRPQDTSEDAETAPLDAELGHELREAASETSEGQFALADIAGPDAENSSTSDDDISLSDIAGGNAEESSNASLRSEPRDGTENVDKLQFENRRLRSALAQRTSGGINRRGVSARHAVAPHFVREDQLLREQLDDQDQQLENDD